MAPDDSRQDTRESDRVFEMMNGRINQLGAQLQQHITDCSAQSRRLFWAVIGCLAWLVGNGLVIPVVSKMIGHE